MSKRSIQAGLIGITVMVGGCIGNIGGDEERVDDALLEARGGKGKDGPKEYNCKPDKVVDQAAQLALVEVLSEHKVHLEATAAADESGTATPFVYVFEDDDGVQTRVAPRLPQTSCPRAQRDDPYSFTVEPLEAKTHYSVWVETRDACGNVAASEAVDITTPPARPEHNPPVVTAPENTRVSMFFTTSPGLLVYADDDTAIDRVEFFANGELQRVDRYEAWGGGVEVHGWSDPEGEYYLAPLDGDLRGTTAHVEAHAYDVYGNVGVSSATLNIPAT